MQLLKKRIALVLAAITLFSSIQFPKIAWAEEVETESSEFIEQTSSLEMDSTEDTEVFEETETEIVSEIEITTETEIDVVEDVHIDLEKKDRQPIVLDTEVGAQAISDEDIIMEHETMVFADAAPSGLVFHGTVTYLDEMKAPYFTVNGKIAFCVQHLEPSPPTGASFQDEVYDNADMRKVLYYGWQGPAQWSGFVNEAQGIIITSRALSHYYSNNPASVTGPYNERLGLTAFMNFISTKSVPSKEISFSPNKVKAYKEDGIQRTEDIKFEADSTNSVTLNLPQKVTLVKSDGTTHTGTVTISGGTTFYLKAPFSVGKSWSSGEVSGSIMEYNPVISVTGAQYQSVGRLELASDPLGTATLDVEWMDAGVLVLEKKNSNGELLNGAKFRVKATASDNDYDEVVTVKNGRIFIEDLTPGKYEVTEITAPNSEPGLGYLLDTTKKYSATVKSGEESVLSVINEEPTGQISLTKTDSVTGSTPQGEGKLSGAVYQLYANKNIVNANGTVIYKKDAEVQGEMSTNSSGKIVWKNLPLGSYYIKEIRPSLGYTLDKTKYTVDINFKDSSTEVIKETVAAKEISVKGKVKIYKRDRRTGQIVTRNSAEFNVYTAASMNINGRDYAANALIETITTVSGVAESSLLPFGSYYVKEKTAPSLYLKDSNTSYPFTIQEDGQMIEQSAYDDPVSGRIELKKVDSETQGDAQGGATLDGAEYTLYAGEDIKNPATNEVIYARGTKITEKTVGTGTWGVEGSRKTNAQGRISWGNLPLGVYQIKETIPSEGYNLDTTVHTVSLNYINDATAVVIVDKTATEPIIRGDIELAKFGTDSIDSEQTEMNPLANVIFSVTSQTNGNTYYMVTNENGYADSQNGTVYSRIITDGNGNMSVDPASGVTRNSRGFFVYDTYIIKELNPPPGYEPVHDITFTLNKQSFKYQWILEDKDIISAVRIEKLDTETGKIIALSGTTFRIYDKDMEVVSMVVTRYPSVQMVDEFVTDETGTFVLPEKLGAGTYYLEEILAPDGYLKGNLLEFVIEEGRDWEEPLTIAYSDKAAMGRIQIAKKDSMTEEGVADAAYSIYAAEDIVTNDGTLHFYAGDLVETVRTDSSGTASSQELHFGKYKVLETESPSGYKLDTEEHMVELVYADQDTPVVMYELNVSEEPNIIYIEKIDGNKKEKLVGATLQLLDEVGSVVDEWVTTEEKHEIKYLPVGVYTIHEKECPVGYLPAEDILVEYDGGIIKSAFVMEDVPIMTEFSKIDVNTKENLSGATLQLLDAEGNVVDEWVTDGKEHEIYAISAGKYVLHEKEVPAGYVREPDIEIEIKEVSGIQTFTMEDAPILTEFNKMDSDTKENLSGATLQLLDSEGNVVDEWVTDGKPHEIYAIPAGRYVLHEKEVPSGYVREPDMEIEIKEVSDIQTFTMKDAPIKTKFKKIDADTKKNLSGATLQLQDEEGRVVDEWVTDGKPHEIYTLPAGKYVLHEKEAPDGYAKAEDIEIEVKEVSGIQTFTMKDDVIKVKIKKINADTKKNLSGAKLQLLDAEGKVVDEWVTDGKPHEMNCLPAGKYVLHEKEAPDGYAKAEDIEIEVKEVSGIQTFIMEDDVIKVRIKKIASDTGENLSGAFLQLLDAKGKVIDGWVTDGKPHEMNCLPAGKYILHEKEAPDGYVIEPDMEIEVKAVSGIQTFTMEDRRWGSITTFMKNYYKNGDPGDNLDEIPRKLRIPKMGDDTDIFLYVMLLISSALLGGYAVFRMRRKKGKTKKLRHRKSAIFFLLMFFVSMVGNEIAFAKEQLTTEVVEYTTKNKDEEYEEFADSVEQDGNTYSLAGIDYEIIKKTPVKEEKVITKNVESGYIPKTKGYKPEKTLLDNGIEFHLKDCTVLDGSEYTKTYTDYIDYLGDNTDVPEEKVINVTDDNGEEVKINTSLSGTELLADGEWMDTDIDITFDHYDSGIFSWQGLTIYDDSQFPLNGYEAELLQSVGADAERYRITSTEWNGDAYEVDGVIYRKAIARAQYFLNYIRATYTGTLDYVKYQSTYTGKTEVDSTTDFNYTIRATATYTMEQEQDMTIRKFVILASIGILILILLIVGILFVVSKKKKDNKKENDGNSIRKRRI